MGILLCLVVSLSLMVGGRADNTVDKPCAKGWNFHHGLCYQVRVNDHETVKSAETSCRLMGATLAYAHDADSLTFLTNLVKQQNAFGFWYGAEFGYRPGVFFVNNGIGRRRQERSQRLGNAIPMPKDHQFYPPTKQTDCVAFTPQASRYSRRVSYVESVKCSVKLPYICRGDPSTKIVPKVGSQYAQNSSSDLYWFSSVTDRQTYQAASDACKAKSMTLLSIRDAQQLDYLSKQAYNRSLDNVDPWWIGLHVAEGGQYTWQNGVTMYADDVLNWNGYQGVLNTRYWRKRILRYDGTVMSSNSAWKYASYICMKSANAVGAYGCPHTWLRAGGSCYKIDKSIVVRSTADRLCKKMGSHLISIDSFTEKTWIKNAIKTVIWTSLNDFKTKGRFVWKDGSTPQSNIVTWSSKMLGRGRCMTFYQYDGSVRLTTCSFQNFPGCQYVVSSGDKCVSKDWSYFNGICYYIPITRWTYKNRRPFATMVHLCRASVEQYNSSLPVTPIKLETKAAANFVRNKIPKYRRIFLGITLDNDGKLRNFDKTFPDMTIFNSFTEPDPGPSNRPHHCVTMSTAGYFAARSCEKDISGSIVCEKEIPYGGNFAETLQGHVLLTMSAIVITFKAIH